MGENVITSLPANLPVLIDDLPGTAHEKRLRMSQKATSEYVFFLDDDTVLHSGVLEPLLEEALDGNYDVVSGGFIEVNHPAPGGTKLCRVIWPTPFNREKNRRNNTTPAMSLVKREAFIRYAIEPVKGFREDWATFNNMADHECTFSCIPTLVYTQFYTGFGQSEGWWLRKDELDFIRNYRAPDMWKVSGANGTVDYICEDRIKKMIEDGTLVCTKTP